MLIYKGYIEKHNTHITQTFLKQWSTCSLIELWELFVA